VEECFDLTRKAFMLAEQSQGPVFLMTDQFLADSFRDVAPFNMKDMSRVQCEGDPDHEKPYKRYAMTGSGVSPRLLPGMGGELVVADSDEHMEDGHITEDLDVRRAMVEKRLGKLGVLKAGVAPPQYGGDDNPEILLVSWGSPRGAVIEAIAILRELGLRSASLHFPQVWPLVPELFTQHFETASTIVMVEGNATGQFAGIIRRETGIAITNRVSRYDGLPITPQYILESLKAQGVVHY
jgi:2-oxoglutarate/2-oxoacid ferredoxin oxidoreductase subunit alpha